jgi:hypothetical protein
VLGKKEKEGNKKEKEEFSHSDFLSGLLCNWESMTTVLQQGDFFILSEGCL